MEENAINLKKRDEPLPQLAIILEVGIKHFLVFEKNCMLISCAF